MDEAGNSTYRILVSVDNIYTACYYMVFEYYVGIEDYIYVAIHYEQLIYNILHNLGSTYDLAEEVYFRALDFEN